jgi:hypothetical protein
MHKKLSPVPRSKPSWFFRDRAGHRYGPYTNEQEVYGFLVGNCVGKVFDKTELGLRDLIRPSIEFVMEDGDGNAICPGDWLDAYHEKRRKARLAHRNKHHRYVRRSGPVSGIHKPSGWKMWRAPKFGRKVRDTGHGCVEDGEPPIRKRLQVTGYCWDDFAPARTIKNWKRYRKHQWRDQ